MEVYVKRLIPEQTSDYLCFFDETLHYIGKAELKCYCVCWASTCADFEGCSTANKKRNVAKRYIKNNYIQGYIAYCNNKVISWCNANT